MIDHLDDYSFLNWMNLQTLSLQENSLGHENSISKRAFRPLKKLKVRKKWYNFILDHII